MIYVLVLTNLAALLQAVYVILISRWGGPEILGQYQTFNSLGIFAGPVTFSVLTVASLGSDEDRRNHAWSVAAWQLPIQTLTIEILLRTTRVEALLQPSTHFWIHIHFLVVTLWTLLAGFALAQKRNLLYGLVAFILPGLRIAGVFFSQQWLARLPLDAILATSATALLFTAIISASFSEIGLIKIGSPFRKSVGTAASAFTTNIAVTSYNNLDTLLLARDVSSYSVGLWGAFLTIGRIPLLAVNGLLTLVAPGELETDVLLKTKKQRKILFLTIFVSFSLAAVVMLFGTNLLQLFFGSQYQGGSELLYFVAPAMAIGSCSQVLIQRMTVSNPKRAFAVNVSGLAAYLIALLGQRPLEVRTVAISYLVLQIFLFVTALIFLERKHQQ